MNAVTTRAERLDRAFTAIAKRGALRRFHEKIKRAGRFEIDHAAYQVLRRLHSEGSARITELAEIMGVEPSTASRHVNLLERRGWLVKTADPSDRRAAVAEVTAVGHELVEEMEAVRRRVLEGALASWSNEDVDRFVALFEKFADDLAAALDEFED